MIDFEVDQKKYKYIEPIWDVLANHPEGISLDKLVKRSHLDKKKMLKTIEQLAIEYNSVSKNYFTRGTVFNLVKRAMNGEKPEEEIGVALANSWIFDKVMLYARCKELDWTDQVMYKEEFNKLKKIWLESRGM